MWLTNQIGTPWATRCLLDRSIALEFVSRHLGRSFAGVLQAGGNARADPGVCRRHSLGDIGTGSPSRAQAGRDRAWCGTAGRAGSPGLLLGVAPQSLARPIGLLALW